MKKIKNRQKRAFTRSALLFTVRVTHFCHFREKPTSMQLFLGKESLQLSEMLKKSKTHLYIQHRVKNYAKIGSREGVIVF